MRVFTALYCHAMAMAGKEMSMPPESSPTKNAMARIGIPELLLIRSNIFSMVRKEGLIIVTTKLKISMTKNR